MVVSDKTIGYELVKLYLEDMFSMWSTKQPDTTSSTYKEAYFIKVTEVIDDEDGVCVSYFMLGRRGQDDFDVIEE